MKLKSLKIKIAAICAGFITGVSPWMIIIGIMGNPLFALIGIITLILGIGLIALISTIANLLDLLHVQIDHKVEEKK